MSGQQERGKSCRHSESGLLSESSRSVSGDLEEVHTRCYNTIVTATSSSEADKANFNIGADNEIRAYDNLNSGADVELLSFNDHSEVPTQQFGVTPGTKSTLSNMTTMSQASTILADAQSWNISFLYKHVKGTMPAGLAFVHDKGRFLQLTDACLRGSSQVFFVNNPLCGFVILVAIAYDSWYSLVFGVTGLIASTVMAHVLSVDPGAIRAGLYGYNGLLTGLAIALFSFGDKQLPRMQMLLPAALMGGMSTIIMIAVANFTVRLFNIAPFTFPFQVASWIWMLAAQSTFLYFPLKFPAPAVAFLAEDMSAALVGQVYAVDEVFTGILAGVAQVYFVGNAVSGAIILLGLALSSPITAILAAFGSALGCLFSMAMGTPLKPLTDGLYGYNPSLTAVAIGGMFFVPSIGSFLYATLACVMTTVLSAATAAGLGPVGMPALTFPFTLASWMFICVGISNPIAGVMPVSLSMVTYPENHRDRFNASRLISLSLVKVLGKLPFLVVQNESDLVRMETRVLPVLLCHYASIGDLSSFKRILNSASDKFTRVNAPDHVGRTPLMIASANGHVHMVKYLLHKSVNVNAKDQYDHTALDEAVSSRNPFLVDLITSRGGRLGAYAQKRMMWAVDRNDIETLALLLRAKLVPSSADMRLRTPLHLAASLPGRLSMIQLLLIHGADIGAKDVRGCSALDDAVRSKQAQATEFFTAYQSCTKTEQTAMLRQVVEEAPAIRSRSASLDGRSVERRQAPIPVIPSAPQLTSTTSVTTTDSDVAIVLPQLLCVAAAQNETREMAYLLGVRPPDEEGEEVDSDLSHAARPGTAIGAADDADTAATDPLQISLKGIRILEQTDRQNHQQMLHTNTLDYDGRSPLAIAATCGSLDACRLLLETGADVNCIDRWGVNPLWCAVHSLRGTLEVVCLLISYGAMLPEDRHLHVELLQKLVRVNIFAAWEKIFVVPDVELDIGDYDGVTAMHLAAKYAAFDSIKALRDAGANPICVDNWGETPKFFSDKASVHNALQRKQYLSSQVSPSKSLLTPSKY